MDNRTLHPLGGRPAGRGRSSATIGLVVLLAVALVAVGVIERRAEVERTGWRLVWHDEFDGEDLDDFRWNAQDHASPRNAELQYYTPNNVRLRRRSLRLTSERVAFGGREYTSAAVDTFGKFSFTYGRVEVRAKLPAMGRGMWPAVWLLGTGCHPNGSPCPWPTPGATELDLMEAVNHSTSVYTNLHYGTSVGHSLSNQPAEHTGADFADDFHTFALEWEPGGSIRWEVDGRRVAERSAPGFFDAPMYLLVNVAVGGTWPGAPTDDTSFPQHLDVDYVRVYQRR